MNNTKIGAKRKTDQRGFVSLVVALTLILVLALITVGFAQLSRREQRQALDKQLSVQAYYASETGINDAIKDIRTKAITRTTPGADGSQCLTSGSLSNGTINLSGSVQYTCVIVNMSPTSLAYDNVSPNTNRTTTFSTNSPLGTMKLVWDSPGKMDHLPGNTGEGFLPFGTWTTVGAPLDDNPGYPGVVDFTIAALGPAFSQDDIINATRTAYLYPSASGTNSVDYASANGSIVSGNCDNTKCTAYITNIPAASQYMIHFMMRYATSNLSISSVNGNTQFLNGQAVIDSTGKAQDVLKRIQVRYPIAPVFDLPNYAIEAQNFCKRIKTRSQRNAADLTATYFVDPSGGNATAANSPECYGNG